MKKQLLPLLLTILLCMVGTKALAYDIEAKNDDGFTIYYNFINDDKELEVISFYSGYYNGDIIIPEEVSYMNNTLKVTSIGSWAFSYCKELTSVKIPNNVTSIGNDAFYNCYSLTSVTFGNSVTSIGNEAFKSCRSLTSIEIPNSVTSIGKSAFDNCYGLTSITIGNGVTSIGEWAFQSCKNMTSITIGNGLKSIERWAFSGCSGLTSIVIPNSVRSIEQWAFSGCSGLTSITIPNSVTSIGDYAFNGCSGLTSMNVESDNPKYDSRDNCNGIIETESNTLKAGCQNTTIPNSVTGIGNGAFMSCSGLTSIEIPNSVSSIGSSAFQGCAGLTSIEIPQSVKSIGEDAIMGCYGLTSIIVDAGNPKYDSRNNCNAIIETETNTLKAGCQNTTIPNGVTIIGHYAFSGYSGLTSITIPNSVTCIEGNAFNYCSGLTSIEIPNSVTSIGGSTFQGCTGLISVTIGNSVTSIGSYAFGDCSGLTSIMSFNKTPPNIYVNYNTFASVDSNCIVWVPRGCSKSYKEAEGWYYFQNIRELINGDTNVDGVVNVADIVETVNAVNGNPSDRFLLFNADQDGNSVDASDIDAIVKTIMEK